MKMIEMRVSLIITLHLLVGNFLDRYQTRINKLMTFVGEVYKWKKPWFQWVIKTTMKTLFLGISENLDIFPKINMHFAPQFIRNSWSN